MGIIIAIIIMEKTLYWMLLYGAQSHSYSGCDRILRSFSFSLWILQTQEFSSFGLHAVFIHPPILETDSDVCSFRLAHFFALKILSYLFVRGHLDLAVVRLHFLLSPSLGNAS